MSSPVSVADLENRFRPLSDDEENIAAWLLIDAWAVASAQVPALPAAVTAGTANADLVTAVLCAMVIRVLRNPDGVRQWSVDDYSEMRDSTVSAGALYLSDDELSLLGGAVGARPRRAFSVGPAVEPRCGGWPGDPYEFAPYGEYGGYGTYGGR